MKEFVYLLRHTYEYGEEMEHEETKIIGIYSSREKAEEVIKRFVLLPGFKNYPEEYFVIEEYLLDKDMWWTEGFIKWEEANNEDSNNSI